MRQKIPPKLPPTARPKTLRLYPYPPNPKFEQLVSEIHNNLHTVSNSRGLSFGKVAEKLREILSSQNGLILKLRTSRKPHFNSIIPLIEACLKKYDSMGADFVRNYVSSNPSVRDFFYEGRLIEDRVVSEFTRLFNDQTTSRQLKQRLLRASNKKAKELSYRDALKLFNKLDIDSKFLVLGRHINSFWEQNQNSAVHKQELYNDMITALARFEAAKKLLSNNRGKT